ncbi:MAG: ABC transporter ATP-binding protein [Saprospiraceae bacterium]|nr:ABC transporter ATP-binding protein [Saprospiraceae bacterium]
MIKSLLTVQDLEISFHLQGREHNAVKGISFDLQPGEFLGVVGESGSGKSVTALSLLQLLVKNGQVKGNSSFLFHGGEELDLFSLDRKSLEKVRGSEIGFVFQDPQSALNPTMRCGEQVLEACNEEKKEKVFELFELVQIKDPERVYDSYPHQLSGGQRQRVMISIAVAKNPRLLILDEATSALDVIIQKEILKLIRMLKNEMGCSVIFISHDLSLVSSLSDRVLVMQKGKIVEAGSSQIVLSNPSHPYTQKLVASDLGIRKEMHREATGGPTEVLLRVTDLEILYPRADQGLFAKKKPAFIAVDRVNFELFKGETLGLVGGSGSGKSSVARACVGLLDTSSGSIEFEGRHVKTYSKSDWKEYRGKVQIIFQDPGSSLDPRYTIGRSITEVLKYHHKKLQKERLKPKALELLNLVELSPGYFDRLPHELSGGEKQRACIARALAIEPSVLVCDEITSALDATVQKNVLDLLKDLQKRLGLTYLFISHDLRVVSYMSDRVGVMEHGRIVEIGKTQEIFEDPKSLYTKKLIEAMP